MPLLHWVREDCCSQGMAEDVNSKAEIAWDPFGGRASCEDWCFWLPSATHIYYTDLKHGWLMIFFWNQFRSAVSRRPLHIKNMGWLVGREYCCQWTPLNFIEKLQLGVDGMTQSSGNRNISCGDVSHLQCLGLCETSRVDCYPERSKNSKIGFTMSHVSIPKASPGGFFRCFKHRVFHDKRLL